MKQNDLIKAIQIKKLLDSWEITSKEATRRLNNELIILWWNKNE